MRQFTLNKYATDTKLGGMADVPEGPAAIQSNYDRQEKWSDRKHMKVSKRKREGLHLVRNNLGHEYMLGATCWEENEQKITWRSCSNMTLS